MWVATTTTTTKRWGLLLLAALRAGAYCGSLAPGLCGSQVFADELSWVRLLPELELTVRGLLELTPS